MSFTYIHIFISSHTFVDSNIKVFTSETTSLVFHHTPNNPWTNNYLEKHISVTLPYKEHLGLKIVQIIN